MDEVESPQTPIELLFILKMLADKQVPVRRSRLSLQGDSTRSGLRGRPGSIREGV